MSDVPVQKSVAQKQWDRLRLTLERTGVQVHEMDQVKGLPDMVFCCNAGIAYKNKVYLAHFRHPERQGEREHYKKWFEAHGFEVHGDTEHFFEGGGDACFAGNKLFAGFGFRSQREVYDKIQKMGDFTTVLCEMKDNRFYHLDTCFFPLSTELAMWFPAAFTEETQKRMKKEIELIAVPEADALKFACNAISSGNTVMLPNGCPKTKEILVKKGFEVVDIDMSEFLKAGGACQCLIMKL